MTTRNYFAHYAYTRNEENIIALRMEMGIEGYGIYFSILEILASNPDYKFKKDKDYSMIAYDLHVEPNKVKRVVEDFNLFEFSEDGEFFYSILKGY